MRKYPCNWNVSALLVSGRLWFNSIALHGKQKQLKHLIPKQKIVKTLSYIFSGFYLVSPWFDMEDWIMIISKANGQTMYVVWDEE